VPLFGAVLRPIQAFFRLEAASGILLLGCAVAALALVNLGGAELYRALLDAPLAISVAGSTVRFTLLALVNDGLMAVFFFLVGMEIKRELVLGELRTPAQAALPAVAALGGMIAPAAIYLAFNHDGPGRPGWGIPMATDIAFSIGVLRLLRARVPHALVVFLIALAIFDDIGGIIVIAVFYGHGVSAHGLAAAAAVAVVLALMGRAYVRSAAAWTVAGGLLWWALHGAGIHPTIAGVVAGLAVPASPRRSMRAALVELGDHLRSVLRERRSHDEELDAAIVLRVEQTLGDVEAPLGRFEHALHPWVAFGVMPLFALANSGVDLRGVTAAQALGPVALGTAAALFLGKLAGIFALTLAAVRLGLAPMPGGASRTKLLGVSIVAGVGFTVALFIATLAFPGSATLLDEAKIGILAGSLVSGVAGALLLRATPPVAGVEPVEPGAERALP
jgi:NhaA family Na+:H+ antiporter